MHSVYRLYVYAYTCIRVYSFGYRYAFHKVRSSGLPGLPVSRSLFYQNLYFTPVYAVYAVYADRTVYAVYAVRFNLPEDRSRPVQTGP